MSNIHFISYNVRGLRDNLKRRKIMRFLNQRKFDVAFIQESHSVLQDEKIWQNEWGGKIYFAHGTNDSKGVGIWIKKGSPIMVQDQIQDDAGRYIILNVSYEGNNYSLVNLYAPNADDPQFFMETFQKMEQFPNDYKVIGGDFNLVLDNEKDLWGSASGQHAHREAIAYLKEYMLNEGLVDVWREQNSDKRLFTYARENPQKYYARLDFFLVSKSLMNFIPNSDIRAGYISDHSTPSLTVAPNLVQRGKGYWKLNTTLLNDKEYVKETNNLIVNTLEEYSHENIKLQWEMVKMNVRGFTIQFATRRKKKAEAEVRDLEKEFNTLKESLPFQTDDNDNLHVKTRMAEIKSKLNEIDNIKTKASMFRTQKNWFQYAEKNSAYFFALEKRNYNRKCVSKLQLENGNVITDFHEIQKEQHRFYQELYDCKDTDEQGEFVLQYLLDIQPNYIHKVKDRDRFILEQNVTVHEIYDSIMTLKVNKCPGIDGLPVEFYRTFWNQLKLPLTDLYESILLDKKFHLSARQSVISLLDKPNKDLLQLGNWRPLSLLNTDYKIWDKLLANRLVKVLEYIIEPYQTGFMKGRHISENISQLLSVVEHCNQNQIDSILISYDYWKAFDSVSYASLYHVLNFFNFGPHFIEMLKILHNDMSAYVTNNGHWSKEVKIGRGLRQGGITSPFLFIVLFQTLGSRVLQNDKIEGISINGVTIKIAQYADDMWTPMKFSQDSFDEMMYELDLFQMAMGLTINYDKTEILRLGSLKNSDAKLVTAKPLKWTNDSIRILGIDVTGDVDTTTEISYENTFQKLQSTLNIWGNRSLSPIGKVILCNTLGASLFVYKMLALKRPSKQLFDRVRRCIVHFIWNNKPPKVKYTKLIQDYQYGGLKLIDLELKYNSLKTIWVRKLIETGPAPDWAKLVYSELPVKDELLWRCNISPQDIKRNFRSSIWLEVWVAWAGFNHSEPNSVPEILDQVIYYNSFIKRNKKMFLPLGWQDLNVKYIRDIYDEHSETFLSYQQFCNVTNNTGQISVLAYTSLVNSIPQSWRRKLREHYDPSEFLTYKNNIEVLMKQNQPSSYYYQKKRNQNSSLDAVPTVWSHDLDINIDEADWNKVCLAAIRTSICPKLRYFQYRLTQRRLVTNYLRNKWDNRISPNCSFCGNHTETVTHILWNCVVVKRLWDALFRWLKYICKIRDFELEEESIEFAILLCAFKGRNRDFINTICLITKQYIYKQKCMNHKLNLLQLITCIINYQRIEKDIVKYKSKKTIDKHNRKWFPLLNNVNM